MTERLTHIVAGTPVLYGGDKVTHVSPELAEAFQPGDHLIVVQSTGDLLHVPAAAHATAIQAVAAASSRVDRVWKLEKPFSLLAAV